MMQSNLVRTIVFRSWSSRTLTSKSQTAYVISDRPPMHFEDRSYTYKEKCSTFLRNSASYKNILFPEKTTVRKSKKDASTIGNPKEHNPSAENTVATFLWEKLKFKRLKIPQMIEVLTGSKAQDSSMLNNFEKVSIVDKSVTPLLEKCNNKQEALQLSYATLEFSGHLCFRRTSFFKIMLQKVNRWIQTCSNHQELVVWAFILNEIQEKEEHEVANLLGRIYDRFQSSPNLFEQLDTLEMGILCNAWFTANIVVDSQVMLNIVERLLKQEIDSQPGNISADAIPMLKVLRKAGYATDALLKSIIASLSLPSAHQLNLATTTH